MDLKLTQQQQAAIGSIGKTTTVSAGAGAGKTRVMVQRYLEIVRRSNNNSLPEDLRAGVGNILTITFTDDAANELKKRLVQELTTAGLHDERRLVETAYISTIHGFCSRLLKENPFESGLDPQFRTLDRSENAALQEKAFLQVVEEGFEKQRPEVVNLFRSFSSARRFGNDGGGLVALIQNEVVLMSNHLRSLGWSEQRLQDWIEAGEGSVDSANISLVAARVSAIQNEVTAILPELNDHSLGVQCVMEQARCDMTTILNKLGPLPVSPSWPDIADCLSQLSALWLLCGKTSTPRNADANASAHVREIMDRLKPLTKTAHGFATIFSCDDEKASGQHAFWLLCLVRDLWQRHTALKTDASALDFNDLQLRARDLLVSSSSVLNRYRKRLRHIMVDEFQDTDTLQKEILENLSNGHNLFCVGDPKQSIYGFRNADVTIFADLIRKVRRMPPVQGMHLGMHENFRSRTEIIALINHVFGSIGVGDGIEYEPLIPRASYGPCNYPCLEILAPDAPETNGGDSNTPLSRKALEAELIARRIRQMVDEQKIRITAAGERQGNPLEYRDFTILLRSFTRLKDYESALSKQAIDHYVVGGRGYYALQEIRDIYNVLQVVRNPLNDIALAATLRSPFCQMSDEALYLIAQQSQGDLYSGIRVYNSGAKGNHDQHKNIIPLPDQDQKRLAPFWTIIEDLRAKQDRTPIASILEEVLAETLYEARLLLQEDGRRKMANVRKLVVAAGVRDRCGITEFVQWLGQQNRVEEKEGEAPTEEEAANVVRIRTIHKAKGLESNVVIVGGMAESSINLNRQPKFLYDLETGAGGMQQPNSGRSNKRQSLVYDILTKKQQQKELDESLRLLYVAMTRAREFLILAGQTPGKPNSWAARVFATLNLKRSSQKEEVLHFGDSIPIVVRSKVSGHRITPPAERALSQKLQHSMLSGSSLDPSDLQNLSQFERIPNG